MFDDESEPPLDKMTFTIWIIIAIWFALVIFAFSQGRSREEIKEFMSNNYLDTSVAQWQSPVFTFRTYGSLMGGEKYMTVSQEQRLTIQCESGWRHYDRYGQILRGKAGEFGIAQFMWDTFELFKEQSGKRDLSIYSSDDQIELMEWAWENDLKSHWTCWRER